MAEHRVPHNGIIYIIPNDELYRKYETGGAFIDKYGRLIDSNSKRVIKELEHHGDQRPAVQRTVVRVQPPEEHPVRDAVRRAVADELSYQAHRWIDWIFYVGGPNLWHEHIVPFSRRTKEALTTKEVKADTIRRQAPTNAVATVKPKARTTMTQEEADMEKRKVLYHWLEMLTSLKKLQDAGEIDATSTLAQLTDPATLERVNGFLSENPNLLETDKYIMLHDLLGRDLYKEKQLIPLEAAEITTIAASYGYKAKTEKTED